MKRHLLLTVAFVLFAFPAHAFWNSDVDKAKEFMKAGMYPQAIELLDKRINDKPTDAEAHFQLGLCYFHTGNYSGADERFFSAVASKPGYKETIAQECMKAGFDSLEKGLHAKAVRLFETAIKYKPSDAETHFQLGLCHFHIGNYSEADERFASAVALNADYKQMIAQKCEKAGFDSLEKGQGQKGTRFFETAIKYQPDLRKQIAQRCYEKGKSLLESAIAQNADYEKLETYRIIGFSLGRRQGLLWETV